MAIRLQRMMPAALAAVGLLLGAAPSSALTLAGSAEVIGSDVISLEGYRIYLHGVESVEEGQTCGIDGVAWECWSAAVRALQTIVEAGPITCETVSGPNVLRQAIAACDLGGEDVGALYVASGFGLTIPTETEAYEELQEAAKAAGIGLWQGTFYLPSVWRQANGLLAGRPTYRPVAPPADAH